MFNISIYLDKFKNIESKNSVLIKIIIDSVKNILKVDIDKKNIQIKNGVIYLKVNPVLKNEIFINKNSLIRELSFKNLAIKGVF